MAKATAHTIKTPVVTTTFVEAKVVTLELSMDEAETLKHILRSVGGCLHTSPRKHSASVLNALDGAGVETVKRKDSRLATLGGKTFAATGSILFSN